MDLIVRNVRVADRPSAAPVDVGVADGKIVAIELGLTGAAETYDAGGRLACAGLVETHIHLDKSRIIDRCPPEAEREISPMRQVAAMKPGFTVEDVRLRAERTLVDCILNGTTRMRTQLEVDPAIGMRGFDAVQSLIADYHWAIDIEICVFPQDGLTNYPGTDELLVEGLERGARAIGGAPRYDTNPDGQIRRIFDLAHEYDVDIDIHLDVGNTPEAMNIHLVCELTEQYRRGGRVVVGHMAKLSTMPPHQTAILARRLADVGVAVTVLPATDLYLMGRNHTQDHNQPRAVVPTHKLLPHGANCSLSSNNVLNPFTPFGDCSLLRIANLYANINYVGSKAGLRECFAMISQRPAQLMRLEGYGVAVGKKADLVVLDAVEPDMAVAEIAPVLYAFKAGRMTVSRSARLHRQG